MKINLKGFPLFIVLAWISAFIFEEIPRAIFIILIPQGGFLHIWEAVGLPFFLIWYGAIFSVAYFIFIKRPIRYVVLFGIIFGLVAEAFVFQTITNIASVLLFVFLYAGMFYLPFKSFSKLKISK